MTFPHPAAPPLGAARVGLALLLDVLLVIAFVALGRREHATEDGLLGLLVTSAPFLTALVAMSLLTRAWRTADRVWPHGVAVWIGTVVLGMALRVLWDLGGAPLAFVLVATIALGLFLLGRRAVSALLSRRARADRA